MNKQWKQAYEQAETNRNNPPSAFKKYSFQVIKAAGALALVAVAILVVAGIAGGKDRPLTGSWEPSTKQNKDGTVNPNPIMMEDSLSVQPFFVDMDLSDEESKRWTEDWESWNYKPNPKRLACGKKHSRLQGALAL